MSRVRDVGTLLSELDDAMKSGQWRMTVEEVQAVASHLRITCMREHVAEEPKETKKQAAKRLAWVLHSKLSSEEWATLRDLLSDYTSDAWLCQALSEQESA